MTKIILNGYLGRMGKVVRGLVEKDPACEIVAGIDTSAIGEGLTFPAYPDFSSCDMPADVVVDFSGVSALRGMLMFGVEKRVPMVICTTGLSRDDEEEIRAASEKVAVFRSANMSLGINLIRNMLDRAAKLLYDARFDVEIIECHHNQKLDAPSGTALLLADAVNAALDGKMEYVYDRSERREKRPRNEIGLHALRGGTVVGEHSVVFAGQDEVITLKHEAHSREIFAVGALKAAAFIKGKPPGLYDMQDLINAL
ncbi:MAG: 4-hydroxy-tetrahydrodipicolinate reductase [Clostridiales bacterium]|nr:4-hydroxy-tetrahydrodipicolinate reductase [Clostridiales bacterium]